MKGAIQQLLLIMLPDRPRSPTKKRLFPSGPFRDGGSGTKFNQTRNPHLGTFSYRDGFSAITPKSNKT